MAGKPTLVRLVAASLAQLLAGMVGQPSTDQERLTPDSVIAVPAALAGVSVRSASVRG